MPNTSYTEAMKEAATLAATDTVILDTIEIAHPDIDSIYLVNDRVELTAAIGAPDGFLSLPGIAGNYASVLGSDITLPTDYLDARIVFGEAYRGSPNFDSSVIPLGQHSIVSGSPLYQSWYIATLPAGFIQMPVWDQSGVQSTFYSTALLPLDADGIRAVIRGTDDLDPSKASAQFFYTVDSGVTWVELDNRVYAATAAVITSIRQSTGAITIGERLDDSPNPFHGTIKLVELYGAAGETDLRLRVDFRVQAPGIVGGFTTDEGVPVTIETSAEYTGGGEGVTYYGGASLINPNTVDSLFDSDGAQWSYGTIAYSPEAMAMGDFTFQIDDITQDDWTNPTGTLFGQHRQLYQQVDQLNFHMRITRAFGINYIHLYLYDSVAHALPAYTSGGDLVVGQGESVSIRIVRYGSEIKFFVDYDDGAGFVQHGHTLTGVHTANTASETRDYDIGAFNQGHSSSFGGTLGRIRIWRDETQTNNVFDLNFASAPIDENVAKIIRTSSITYEPVGFKFKLPSITGNGVQDLSLEFSNVDRRVNDFIETIEASLDPVTVTHRVYLSGGDINSLPESDPPLQLTLSDIEISAFKVRARASFVNIVNKQYPTEYYDRERFPNI